VAVPQARPVAFASAVRAFEAARPEPKPDEGAQQEIAECDAKLRQHRAALEAGADPVLITSWMKETQARRALAEARLKTPAARRRMTQEEITSLVTGVGEIMQALNEADPADKAEVYGRLGLTLTYHPSETGPGRSPTRFDHVRKRVSEGGLEPTKSRIFPDSALEYAGGGEIPCPGISCAHASGRGSAGVKRIRRAASRGPGAGGGDALAPGPPGGPGRGPGWHRGESVISPAGCGDRLRSAGAGPASPRPRE
jgi:hypothetical protein